MNSCEDKVVTDYHSLYTDYSISHYYHRCNLSLSLFYNLIVFVCPFTEQFKFFNMYHNTELYRPLCERSASQK